jgi:ribosomal protein L37AE/L43A
MPKIKSKPVCVSCGSNDALYITLKNGERLPSYVMRIGAGIWCNQCDAKDKAERAGN